ncbi:hypothetical protein [Undibacterium baiyunense]|nr:hypothetical protein [Undibacterium baiyunense]
MFFYLMTVAARSKNRSLKNAGTDWIVEMTGMYSDANTSAK